MKLTSYYYKLHGEKLLNAGEGERSLKSIQLITLLEAYISESAILQVHGMSTWTVKFRLKVSDLFKGMRIV